MPARVIATRRTILRHGAAALLAAGSSGAARAATRLAVAKVAADFALVMVDFGQRLGIPRRGGLDLDIVQITQAKMVQAVVAGSIDIALAGGATLAFAAKGAPLKAVAALSGPPAILVLIVRPDDPIAAPDQLRGRTVAVTNVGSLTDWAVSQIAASRGWAVGDIRRVGVGDTPARVAALRTRAVDAAVIDIAAALDLEERGVARILLNFGDLITAFHNQMIFASDAAIADKPDAVRAFVAGWFETVAYARGHKAETVAFAEEALGVRTSVAAKVYDQLMGSNFFSPNGVIDPAILAAMSRSFVELKLLPEERPLAQYVTERFLPK
jgi:ABC-type nitrate/sulfonate/bicarbonate transport system substrate-binding protein